jgi:hypothetical protein
MRGTRQYTSPLAVIDGSAKVRKSGTFSVAGSKAILILDSQPNPEVAVAQGVARVAAASYEATGIYSGPVVLHLLLVGTLVEVRLDGKLGLPGRTYRGVGQG